MTTLHDEIMNIRDGCGLSEIGTTHGEQLAYKRGHRNARHAAAELAIASDARIAELEAEGLEQARIIGIGAERELALMARVEALEAALKDAIEALSSVHRYGADTLSGRTDGPDDRTWQRQAVLEMTNRAYLAILKGQP